MKILWKRIAGDKQSVNSLFLLLQKSTIAAIGYVFWIFAARIYPSEQIGLATTVAAALWMIVVISMLGFGETVVRFLPAHKSPDILISAVIMTASGVALLLSLVFIVSTSFWNQPLSFLQKEPSFAVLFVVLAVLWTILTIFEYLFLAIEKTQYALWQTLIWALGKIAVIAAIYRLSQSGYHVIYWSWLLSGVIAFLISWYKFIPKYFSLAPVYKPSLLGQHYKFSLMSCFTLFLTFSLQMILPLIIISQLGSSASAYFYFDWTIAFLLCTIANAISSAMFARISNDASEFKTAIRKALCFFAISVLPAAVLLFLFAGKVLLIFGLDYSRNGTLLLKYLAIGTVLYIFFSIYKYLQLVLKRADRALAVEGLVTAVTVFASLVFLKQGGLSVIGKAWIAALFIPSLYSLYLVVRIMIFNLPETD